jgi:DNA-directed RNA polymerase specialized sigma subunit
MRHKKEVMTMAADKELTLDEIIHKAIQATRLDFAHKPKDAYKATEQRLYAYPTIKSRIEIDKEQLEYYLQGNMPSKSVSLVRFQKTGNRLSDEEILEGLITDLKAQIAANEYEASEIEKAIEYISGDEYAKVITCLFIEGKTIEQTCDEVCCSKSTVSRQKNRLIERLSVYLYGVHAVT